MKVTMERGKGCNLCDRGKLSRTAVALVYPYEFVYIATREGSGIALVICEDCIRELVTKTMTTI